MNGIRNIRSMHSMHSMHSMQLALWAVLVAVLFALAAPSVALAATTTVLTEDELRAAVGQGSAAGEIKLASNIALNETLDLGACTTSGESDCTVVIDLAGHNLEAESETVKKNSIIKVPSGFTLTVRDSAGGNNGSITGAARGVENHGSFTFTTGGIRNNSGFNDGNGLYNDEGGVATITGGVIEGNEALGDHDGAGIYNRGQLHMTGGVIQNNKTNTGSGSGGYGGGICNGKNGNFTLGGGTVQNNAAERGGGVYNAPDCEVMVIMGRVKIQSNTATDKGGAIYNGKSDGGTKLSIVGGAISNNTAGDCGGGIANDGVMAASAGAISNNTAGRYGGGIYDNGKLALSGSIVVKGNKGAKDVDNDTYLTKGKRITVEEAFNNRARVGIVCEDPHQIFTTGYRSKNPEAALDAFFFTNPNGDQKDTRIFLEDKDEPGELRCVVVIHYRKATGGDIECIDYEDVTSDHWGEFGETTWFVVRESTTIRDDIGVRGDVNLILCSNKTLITEGIGIRRQDDHGDRAKLTIWNSVGDDGYLVADATDGSSAGIGYKKNSGGVGTLVINGGNIKALGGDEAAGIGGVENRGNGPVTINNGHVEAYGGEWGAGIGGGQGGDQDNTIKILGGYVYAEGGKYSAGIGGGDSDHGGADGGKVIIKNAEVHAKGGSRGAGIGGGEDGRGGDVTIENSTVIAKGGGKGPGIGGGQDSDYGGKLTVKSGTVKAYGGYEAAGIGGGEDSCGGDFIAEGGTIFAFAGDDCATGIGAGHGDYHEGTKKLYPTAKVTASREWKKEPPDIPRKAIPDSPDEEGDQRLEGLTWQSVMIEPCNHPDGATYRDIDSEKHYVNSNCKYCGLAGTEREEAHVFNADHRCACGHVEDPIVLKRDKATQVDTKYASRGSEYVLPAIQALEGEEKVLSGWAVSGLDGTNDGTVLSVGSKITVKPRGDSTITLTAQWVEDHKHVLVCHEAQAPTCTEPGHIKYWACEGGDHPCGRCFTDERGYNEVPREAIAIDALGHEWGEATYKWLDDGNGGKKCTGTHACTREGCSYNETVDAVVLSVEEPPSCTKPGGTYYIALFFREGFKTQRIIKEDPTTPATGHTWGEPTYTWSDDNSTCTATRVCAKNPDHEETETVESVSESSEPTCKYLGAVTYTATFENTAFEKQVKTVENSVNPLGHDWGNPTYTWSDNYSTCTASRTCLRDASHVETKSTTRIWALQFKIRTCTEPGETKYIAVFEGSDFQAQVKTVTTAALGHDWGEWMQTTAATELSEGVETRTCSNDSSHTETRTIPKTNHVHELLSHVAAVEPTCTEAGVSEHWVCKGGSEPCGLLFKDENAEIQINEEDTRVAPLGHNWGKPYYAWNADNASCSAIHFCTRNTMHFEVEAAKAASKVIAEPTCTAAGKIMYTAMFANDDFATQTKTEQTSPLGHEWGDWKRTKDPDCVNPGEDTRVCNREGCGASETREVPATGHDWGPWVVTKPATETSDGVETRTCNNVSSHTETRTIPKVGHVHGLSRVAAVAPTCTTAGVREHWVCSGGSEPCGRLFADASGKEELSESDVILAALGHDWGDPTYTWSEDNLTCTAKITCTRNPDHEESEQVETEVKVSKNATCTEGGRITYIAHFKNTAFVEQTKIVQTAALGHTPASSPKQINVIKPTCEGRGSYDSVSYCTTCGEELKRETVQTDPLGHDWGEWEVRTPATSSSEGVEARTCKVDESHVETRKIPKLACEHSWDDGEITVAPTCTTEGMRTYKCSKCESTKTEAVDPIGHIADKSSSLTIQEPTCVAWGFKWNIVQCSTCEQELSRILIIEKPLDHDWGDWKLAKEPTETEPGEITRKCKRDESHTETILTPTAGHTWGEPAYKWSPDHHTCTATHTCVNCGEAETEIGQAIATVIKRATCELPGQTTYTATFANDAFETQAVTVADIAELGHDWGEWVVTKPATETEKGLETRTCARCGVFETRDIPPKESGDDPEGGGEGDPSKDDPSKDDPSKDDSPDAPGGFHVMYRLYNPYSGEHHYTTSPRERDEVAAAGWQEEGVAWLAPESIAEAVWDLLVFEGEGWVAPEMSTVPVYRLYNSNEPLGDHHYTTDRAEYDALVELGWTGEGVGWYSASDNSVPIHRVYNPNAYAMGMSGAHHYTVDVAEYDGLVELGWHGEGVGWYGI